MKEFVYANQIVLFLLTLALSNLPSPKTEELRSLDANRQKMNFNAGWLYFRGAIAEDAAARPSFRDKAWQAVHLPHNPKVTALRHPWKPDNEGVNWYRKHFHLAEKNRGRKVFIEFEAADQVADVWINGTHLLTHKGPYLPFIADITDYAQYGERENLLTVKVNNFADRDIPSYGNWISFGGLYRDACLRVTDRLHITDPMYAGKAAGGGVFVTYPRVNDSRAEIEIQTHVFNEHPQSKNCKLMTTLVDADGHSVSMAETQQRIVAGGEYNFTQRMIVTGAHLWHPNNPYLYRLVSEVYDGETLVDSYQTKIGIRRIQFSHENGFTINGKRFLFMGTNRVQDYPYVAWAFPNAAQRRDAILLKEGGFQYVRTSHNPQDPSFLDACDELGILVMDCIPGFQYIGGPQFRENSFQTMREVIRRDRNHPSAILWELSLNETDYDSSFAETAMQIGHEEFPGDQCFVAGWKFPSVYDVFLRASQHGARNYTGKTPLVISEYGHWDFGFGNSTSDVDRSDGEAAMLVQVQNHQESLSKNRGLPFLCGDGLWVGLDFQCYPSGVIDYFRIPKFSYYFYQSQRDPGLHLENIDSGPMVYIANYWREQSPRTVTVFSNCDHVELFLNGKLLAVQKPDTGMFTEHLLHPPFTFSEVRWEPGELKAVGYLNGKTAASHRRMTPGEATHINIDFNFNGDPAADGEDLFFAYASVVDKNGTTVGDSVREITFQVSGPGMLISPEKVQTEAGVGVALIRTAEQPGEIVIKAEAEGIKSAVVSKNCVSVNR